MNKIIRHDIEKHFQVEETGEKNVTKNERKESVCGNQKLQFLGYNEKVEGFHR